MKAAGPAALLVPGVGQVSSVALFGGIILRVVSLRLVVRGDGSVVVRRGLEIGDQLGVRFEGLVASGRVLVLFVIISGKDLLRLYVARW